MGDPTSLANFLVGDWRREGLVGDGAFFCIQFWPAWLYVVEEQGRAFVHHFFHH